jgi:uncharacterized protein YhbP (UPF0306 family)
MNVDDLAKEYVTSVKHMQLATSKDGTPWICTVYFVADDGMNFYWTSGRDRQHSLEILANPKAAVTVVKDSEKKRALQMTGEAQEVSDDDLGRVHQLYMSKFGSKDYDLEEMRQRKPDGRSYWVFTPTKMMFWDEIAFPDAPKQEYRK